MALIFAESFDGYDGSNSGIDLRRKWTYPSALWSISSEVTGHGVPPRRVGNQRFQTNGFATAFRPGSRRLWFGTASNGYNVWNGGFRFCVGYDGNLPMSGWHVAINKVGSELQVNRADGTVLYSIPNWFAGGPSSNGWHYYEIMMYTHPTVSALGEVEVRIDGVTVYSGTDVPLGTNPTYMMGLVGEFDDMYICDDTGEHNRGFLCPVGGGLYIDIIRPNGVGSSTTFTGNNGAKQNWEHVNDLPPLNHDEYVEKTGADADELYEYEDVGLDIEIFGLMVNTYSSKSNTGDMSKVQTLARPTTTTYDYNLSRALSSTYNYNFYDGIDVNPDTNERWTPEELNASEFGFRSVRVV